MQVLMINGSPHPKGCTFTALSEIARSLAEEQIESEILWIGSKPARSCIACEKCKNPRKNRCIFDDDMVNLALEKLEQAQGLIVGSPVHYAAASGLITSFLGRLFYSGKNLAAYKPGAAIVSCRRAGSTAALEQLNKFFTINNMPLVSSQYWNMVHGMTPDEVKQDLEGMQTMRTLGKNMAWLLRSIEAGKQAGIQRPEQEPQARTNFIR